MNSLELLKALIDKLSHYEAQAEDKNALSIEGFAASLNPANDLELLKNSIIGKTNPEILKSPHHIANNIERVIAQHILLLYRYIKFYAKTAFAESNIRTMEEFSFLINVMQHERITKTDLIRKNIIEKSSGIEIINRLIKSKMFIQVDNPEDQRSHLIQLTDYGKSELFMIFGKMNTLGKIATGSLNDSEKEQLALMLKKLDHFHYENYNNKELKVLEDYLPSLPQN